MDVRETVAYFDTSFLLWSTFPCRILLIFWLGRSCSWVWLPYLSTWRRWDSWWCPVRTNCFSGSWLSTFLLLCSFVSFKVIVWALHSLFCVWVVNPWGWLGGSWGCWFRVDGCLLLSWVFWVWLCPDRRGVLFCFRVYSIFFCSSRVLLLVSGGRGGNGVLLVLFRFVLLHFFSWDFLFTVWGSRFRVVVGCWVGSGRGDRLGEGEVLLRQCELVLICLSCALRVSFSRSSLYNSKAFM